MRLLDWGDLIVIDGMQCPNPNCTNGPMAQIDRMNLPACVPDRKGAATVDRRLVPGRDVIVMLCHRCGFVSLFDAHTLERQGKLQK